MLVEVAVALALAVLFINGVSLWLQSKKGGSKVVGTTGKVTAILAAIISLFLILEVFV